jgi:hypothetical protein
MATCDCCGRIDLMNDGSCCDCCNKAVDIGLAELKRRKDLDRFNKFIAELSQNIGAYSCGCMGSRFTLDRVKKDISGGDDTYRFITDVFDKYYKR